MISFAASLNLFPGQGSQSIFSNSCDDCGAIAPSSSNLCSHRPIKYRDLRTPTVSHAPTRMVAVSGAAGVHKDKHGESKALGRKEAVELNKRISSLKTVDDIRQLLQTQGERLSCVNISTAAVRLAKLHKEPRDRSMKASELALAVGRVASAKIAGFHARQLSNLVWAMGSLMQQGNSHELGDMLAAMERQAVTCWHRGRFLAPHELSMTMWGFARLNHEPTYFLDALQENFGSSLLLAAFGPQEVSNFAWACARMSAKRDTILDPLARRAAALACDASPKVSLSLLGGGLVQINEGSPLS